MAPSPLDGKPISSESGLDRRQYFADWLTAPDNPHFAKAVGKSRRIEAAAWGERPFTLRMKEGASRLVSPLL